MLDQHSEVAAFNMRTNPALKTNSWSYSEELGEPVQSNIYTVMHIALDHNNIII